MVTNINIPNIGQIDGIPRGCVVETNACLSQNSIVPLMAGKRDVLPFLRNAEAIDVWRADFFKQITENL
ncbi:MAG: hypothetical protein M0P55_09340 [Clostridiales bacterium]|jgi:hypothetical protein|nr:hypothetical protein [Clostridiales bacterium]